MAQLVDLIAGAVMSFIGLTPDRPLWLRRIVQICWTLAAALVVLAWAYGLVMLTRAL